MNAGNSRAAPVLQLHARRNPQEAAEAEEQQQRHELSIEPLSLHVAAKNLLKNLNSREIFEMLYALGQEATRFCRMTEKSVNILVYVSRKGDFFLSS